jgi:hypothetical protein
MLTARTWMQWIYDYVGVALGLRGRYSRRRMTLSRAVLDALEPRPLKPMYVIRLEALPGGTVDRPSPSCGDEAQI